jgi:hypothetical protein
LRELRGPPSSMQKRIRCIVFRFSALSAGLTTRQMIDQNAGVGEAARTYLLPLSNQPPSGQHDPRAATGLILDHDGSNPWRCLRQRARFSLCRSPAALAQSRTASMCWPHCARNQAGGVRCQVGLRARRHLSTEESQRGQFDPQTHDCQSFLGTLPSIDRFLGAALGGRNG